MATAGAAFDLVADFLGLSADRFEGRCPPLALPADCRVGRGGGDAPAFSSASALPFADGFRILRVAAMLPERGEDQPNFRAILPTVDGR